MVKFQPERIVVVVLHDWSRLSESMRDLASVDVYSLLFAKPVVGELLVQQT